MKFRSHTESCFVTSKNCSLRAQNKKQSQTTAALTLVSLGHILKAKCKARRKRLDGLKDSTFLPKTKNQLLLFDSTSHPLLYGRRQSSRSSQNLMKHPCSALQRFYQGTPAYGRMERPASSKTNTNSNKL